MEGQLFSEGDERPPPEVPDGAPLAARLRPADLAQVLGQEELLGPDQPLRRAIEQGRPHSMVLFGPPGTGKTTLARIVARASDAALEELSAVEVGRADVRGVIERARERHRAGRDTVLFLDEIHRFNKAQQDALLPAVEDGTVILIGATTENPWVEVNPALLSRARIYELQPLSVEDVRALLDRGAEALECEVDPDQLDELARSSGGDARVALQALEVACETGSEVQRDRVVRFDKSGEIHYDTMSAWIKSTRASDPDASLYYLGVMLEGGEDPRYIARRMVILASEDVGNADPQALGVAVDAAQTVQLVGLPECTYALAQAAIYLALAPKSDAAGRSLGAARRHLREHGSHRPPDHLRSSYSPPERAARGRGQGYENPHSEPDRLSDQRLLPEEVGDARFWDPQEAEPELARRWEDIRRRRADRAG